MRSDQRQSSRRGYNSEKERKEKRSRKLQESRNQDRCMRRSRESQVCIMAVALLSSLERSSE